MAIREVLVSFTFEQQRQMINLIGADIGDASLLLTPTPVLVTAINEVITGDVDLSNQTIGMDDGTLVSPSLFWDAGQGFYKVDATKLGLTTSLAITGDLEVDGDITFRAGSGTGGTLTFGDLDTDNIVFNADVQSSIVPDSTANYNLGSLAKQWNNIWIDGTASIDTLTVDENATVVGNLTINSGNVLVPNTQTNVDLFDDYATTVEAFGAGTSIRIGDVTGTLTIRNPTIVGTQTSINVFNTVATQVSAFGAAEDIYMGVALGGGVGSNSNFTIRSDDTILFGDLNVNGGEILSSQNTFDLLINNNDVRIGAANGAGETVINNSLNVKENVNLSNSGTNIAIKDNLTNSLTIKEGSNTYLQFQTTDAAERIIVWKDLYIIGNLDISGTTTVIDTTNLEIKDKNITLADTAAPTDALADGGGITLKGTTDKTITYSNTNNRWESNIEFYSPGISLNDNEYLYLGTNNDIQIYHSGTVSYINDLGIGGLYIQGSDRIELRDYDTSEQHIVCLKDSAVELYFNNTKKLSTSADGVTVLGRLTASTSDATSADSGYFLNSASGGDNRILITTFANGGGDPYLKFDSGGSNHIVGQSYGGGASNKLILGVGESPSTGAAGLAITGYGTTESYSTSLGNATGSGITLFDLGSANRPYIARGFVIGFGSNADWSFEITGLTGGTVTELHKTQIGGSGGTPTFSSSSGAVTVTNGVYNCNVYLTFLEYNPNDATA